ncbi:uncharacterized protein LOC118344020 [Juglans regia]|uniref:Uncharacterized protein LOC118344020 n=1 Tax=Juglans regia TaxID=51240 RepID=A0A6P9DWL8_JUGRE|nr:uncharacterized protein LOC118344020 [Juglans regia]
MFVISFENQKDRERVLEGKPWLFDNQLFVLKLFDGLTPPRKMNFDFEEFWVHLNNLPLACMSREVGMQIGATVGNVKGVDIREDGIGWGSYLRVKIEIDLRKKISRGRIANVMGNKLWIPLSYEKLPKVCFKCGKIFHGGEGCLETEGNNDKLQYGVWLRASYLGRGKSSESSSNKISGNMSESEGEFNHTIGSLGEKELGDGGNESQAVKGKGAQQVFDKNSGTGERTEGAGRSGKTVEDCGVVTRLQQLEHDKEMSENYGGEDRRRWKRRARGAVTKDTRDSFLGGKRKLRSEKPGDNSKGATKKGKACMEEGVSKHDVMLVEAASQLHQQQ